jgi:hypothetical protein
MALNARFYPYSKPRVPVLVQAELGFRNPLAFISINTGIFQNVRVKSPINNGIGIGDRKDIMGIASYTPIDE